MWILCGLPKQVGAVYRNHGSGRNSSLENDIGPRDVCGFANRAATVQLWNLSALDRRGNRLYALRHGIYRTGKLRLCRRFARVVAASGFQLRA